MTLNSDVPTATYDDYDDYDEVWHATLAGEFDKPEDLGYHPGEDS